MAHIRVEVNNEVLFDGEVDDWNLPPTPPQAPGAIKAANLPRAIKQVLAKALAAKLTEVTGFKVNIKV